MNGNQKLPERAYLSNINGQWPIERQEALLAEQMPGWPKVARYQDVLTPRQRQSHRPALLRERNSMLRATRRVNQEGERIYLASMAVFAWDGDDLETSLRAAWARNAVLMVADIGVKITSTEDARDLFRASRKKASIIARSKAGAAASAAIRRQPSDEGIERIKDRWGMPAKAWSTKDLLMEAGVTYNTVTARLGGREMAQKRYEAAQKRAARRNASAD